MAATKSATKTIDIQFELDKETKNTIRYAEQPNDEGKPPMIGTLYLQKWALGKDVPSTISITVALDPKA